MKEDIVRMVEEHPEVKRLEEEIEQRTNRLHREILALGISLPNIQRFLDLYHAFYRRVCSKVAQDNSHVNFLDDFMANGDLQGEGKDKSQKWLEWQLNEVERTLTKMKRYTTLAVHNRKLKEENAWLKDIIMRHGIQCHRPPLEREPVFITDGHMRELMNVPVESIDFSVRVLNALKSIDVKILGELLNKTEKDLMKIRNFGKTSLNEVKDKLDSLDLHLDMNVCWEESGHGGT